MCGLVVIVNMLSTAVLSLVRGMGKKRVASFFGVQEIDTFLVSGCETERDRELYRDLNKSLTVCYTGRQVSK